MEMLTLIRRRRRELAETWASCEICRLGCRAHDLREIEQGGRRVKACPSCRARLVQERLRRERGKEIAGTLYW